MLADHVLTKVVNTIVEEEEIEDLEAMAVEISDYLYNFDQEDMGEIFEVLEDLFGAYRDIHQVVIADSKGDSQIPQILPNARINRFIRDNANLALKLFEKLLSWNDLNIVAYSDESLRVINDNKEEVQKLTTCLSNLAGFLRDKKDTVPYRDKDMFELAQGRFPPRVS